jgi:hypothetical protein
LCRWSESESRNNHWYKLCEFYLCKCPLPSSVCSITWGSGRAVYGVGLRPLACWECGFESCQGI